MGIGSTYFVLLRQPLAEPLAWTLVYSLPPIEIGIVVLLILNSYRGLSKPLTNDRVWNSLFLNPYLLSTVLLSVFSGYIAIALMGAWSKIPCGCGSVISGMSWGEHLVFNLVFLGISILGLRLSKIIQKEEYRQNITPTR